MTSSVTAPPAAGRTQARAGFDLQRAGLPVLLAVFVLLGAMYAIVTPLFEVSDELWHYPMVKTLADGQGLPVQNPANPGAWRQEGSQPPLYYALMALATSWIDTSDLNQVRWINPHADNGIITADGNNNIVIHTEREAWPWTGTVLAVRLIRLLSVLMGAAAHGHRNYGRWKSMQGAPPGRIPSTGLCKRMSPQELAGYGLGVDCATRRTGATGCAFKLERSAAGPACARRVDLGSSTQQRLVGPFLRAAHSFSRDPRPGARFD